jgi:hypothetical protein
MNLHRILYRSVAEISGPPSSVEGTVQSIVERSRIANAACGVTGAMMFSSGVFLQAIEGEPQSVEATFERICSDLRHSRLQMMDFSAADTRAFAEFPMAVVPGEGKLQNLCASLSEISNAKVDPTSASALIQLMRALTIAGSEPASDRQSVVQA